MNPVVLVVIIVIVVELVVIFIQRAVGDYVLKHYVAALDNHDLDGALAAINSKSARFFVPPFNRDYMRFNAYQLSGDTKGASESLDVLLTAKISKKQRGEVVLRAYYFYLEQERFDDAKAMLEEIRAGGNEKVTNQCELAWATFAENDYSHIDELQESFDKADAQIERMNLAMLIAAQYTNKGDLETAKAWTEKLANAAQPPKEKGDTSE